MILLVRYSFGRRWGYNLSYCCDGIFLLLSNLFSYCSIKYQSSSITSRIPGRWSGSRLWLPCFIKSKISLKASRGCSSSCFYLCSRTRVLWKILCLDLGAICQYLVWLQAPSGLHCTSGFCKQLSFEISDYMSFFRCIGRPDQAHRTFSLKRLGSAHCWAGVMPSPLVPCPRLQTTSIFFLVTSPLISRTAVLTPRP